MQYLYFSLCGQNLWSWLGSIHVSLQVRGGPTACHVHTDRKLLQDADYFLMGLTNQRDAIDLRGEKRLHLWHHQASVVSNDFPSSPDNFSSAIT